MMMMMIIIIMIMIMTPAPAPHRGGQGRHPQTEPHHTTEARGGTNHGGEAGPAAPGSYISLPATYEKNRAIGDML